jgi:hypothetical protein
MQIFKHFFAVSIGLITCIGFSDFLSAKESHKHVKMDKKEVPAAVMTAFEKEYPDVKTKKIEKKEKEGVPSFEFKWKEGTIKHEVEYKEDGAVLENESKEEIKWKEIPKTVKKAMFSAYPKGKIGEAEKITTVDNSVKYKLNVKDGNDKFVVILDETGKVLKTKNRSDDKKESEKAENK